MIQSPSTGDEPMWAYLSHLRIDWAAVAAVAALTAAGIAGYQIYLSRFALGVDLVMKLDERFESAEFRTKRKRAAQALQTKENLSDVEDILDFFETLGLLTRRKALDKEMVWNTFFYWHYGYWLNAKDYIEKQRKEYSTRYSDLLWLQAELLAIERKKQGTLDPKEWNEFLQEELEGEE